MMFRAWFLISILLLVVIAANPILAEPKLIVGLRNDAPPFSYLRGQTDDTEPTALEIVFDGGVYSGFMVQLCATVIDALSNKTDFGVEYKIVEPDKRYTDLDSGRINILCDPATITQVRMKQEGILVSQPLYLSGIGLAKSSTDDRWIPHWPCIGPLVGVVAGTTARPTVVKEMAQQGRFGPTDSEVILRHASVQSVDLSEDEQAKIGRCEEQAVTDGIDPAQLAEYAAPSDALVVREFDNHTDLAEALCQLQILYSVGDLEIIARSLQIAKLADYPQCKFQVDAEVFTEERYGIYVHVSDAMDENDRLVLAFLQELSLQIHRGNKSVLVQSFKDNFDAQKISRTLDLFFWSVIASGG